MKYAIELTDNQKKQMDALIEIAHKHIGFNPKLEPIQDSWTSELDKHRKQAYDRGYEVGYNEGLAKQSDQHFVPLQKCPVRLEDCKAYKLGLEDGYKGYKYLDEWFVEDFEGEGTLFPEYKRRQANACCLEDIITDVGFAEMLKRVKAYEEKKKAKEIKVGDEMEYLPTQTIFYVLGESPQRYKGFYKAETNIYMPITFCDFEKHNCKPTGRHFEEITQLLDKLSGEENNE